MFVKYVYWMDQADFDDARNQLLGYGEIPVETKKAVCLPLSTRTKVGYVTPDAWSGFETCRRQLSWYANSEYAGRYLLISSTEIRQYGISATPAVIITRSDFHPPRLPPMGDAMIQRMSNSLEFQRICPPEFLDIASMGEEAQARWLKIMGIRGITYPELFVMHCANHANFIQPEYHLETADGCIPSSIGKTKQVCSACLEFYNLIGGNFRKKMVVPCPGAVLFAGMIVNQYYQVETVS
jgi:hypothetical protein